MNFDPSNAFSVIFSLASVIVAVMAVLISLIGTILQFRKRRAFVWPLNPEQEQPTIAVPIAKAPTLIRERYPEFEDEHPDCGGGYIVFANSGDRAAFVMLTKLTVTPSFIRVARYPQLAVPPGEIARHELLVHNIPPIPPNGQLQITIEVEYSWIEASRRHNGRKRAHDGHATLTIVALRSYPTEQKRIDGHTA